jgi:amino acid adenylation domain-containing protein
MVDTAHGLQGTLQYNTDLFEAATINRLITHFETLLQGIVNASESKNSSLLMLPAEEREQLLYQWNQKRQDYHGDSSLHEWFERQAERTPAAVALVFDQIRLSYRELNERANQLAHYLRRLGVGPEVMVGLYVERSPEMVVAILGILKAGGAYVPLDTMYPKDRLAFMLEDASIRLVLSQSKLAAALPEREMTVVTLDTEWETLASQNTENPRNLTTCENLAYVIFTSGSTGRPKGTLVSHGNVVRLFAATEDWYHFDERDVWTLFHSSAFDFSVWELWGALLYGGSLVIVPFILSRSPEAFYELLQTEHVTVLNQTPSAFRQLMEVDREAWSRSNDLDLRFVIFGGEALEVRSLSEWYERHAEDRPRLINMYGITETTVHVTYRPLSRIDAETRYASPIGCAIPDLELYILDAQLGPVPIGVPGALYVGGSGLARGYLNRPELTAERFIPHPYSTNPGARLYQTGDLARYRSDGDIEYLGRIDQQVKIRGFRIELGEIEAVMRSHPAISDVVVVAREDEPGEKRLVGYFVAAPDLALTIDDLRSYLKETLAEYMIPTSFVVLDHMPLTPQGKVDRKALPAPDTARPYLQEEFVTPRTWQEQKLAEIWSQYLGVDPIGIHDNFFVLGGHSLLATQLISQIREVFQVELPLRALFEAPTIATLGEKLQQVIEAGRGLLLPDIERVERVGPLPLSFAQQRLWFINQLEPNSAAYNLPLAMRLSGPLNLAALERSLSEIMRRHESLRTSFPVRDGRPVQLINDAQLLTIPVTDLSELSAAEREAAAAELARAEARRTFELASGPLLRVSLLRLDEEEHVALMTMHHIVADGWSLSVLVKEMTVLYEAYCRGLESPLEELPVQYADFAVWQRGWLKGDLLETQLEYWRKQLSGAAVLALPTDKVRPAAPTFRGATQNMQVGKEVTEGLKELSRRAGVTLFMTLLAAFKTLLYRLDGQEEVVVGTGIANRTRGEVEGLIGFFTNTLVLRTDLSGDPSFSELLGRVRDVTLGAYAHQDVPFEKLVEELEPERYLGHAPLFQVMFSFHNSPIEPLTLSGLTLQPFNTTAGTAHFELLLAMQEVQEEIQGTFEYNTDLFDETTITRISNHFRVLLEGIAAHPEWSLIDLPLFPGDEASGRRDRSFLESEDNEEEFSFQR